MLADRHATAGRCCDPTPYGQRAGCLLQSFPGATWRWSGCGPDRQPSLLCSGRPHTGPPGPPASARAGIPPSQYRSATGHRFQDRHAKTLIQRGIGKKRSATVQGGQILIPHESREKNTILQPQLQHPGKQILVFPAPLASDHQDQVRMILGNGVKGLDQAREILAGLECGKTQDVGGIANAVARCGLCPQQVLMLDPVEKLPGQSPRARPRFDRQTPATCPPGPAPYCGCPQ